MELVWDDSVSPEPAIDFEGASVSTAEVLGMITAAFGSLFLLYKLVDSGNPRAANPAVSVVLAYLAFVGECCIVTCFNNCHRHVSLSGGSLCRGFRRC